ncbi:MAG: amidohydrolase family protein [Cryomorphaceae bacterium]|jgi:imidazolonepropionase-like amidohydrolase|nr:amidohydrolase family protein [Cryomorphaceae bacterium]MDG1888991.1 amidohydrolase family protein [Flavobacteriaceae bacterium]MBT3503243.1 amidohydrolase family protein [Cryomorphaceae bacterium]MBT3689363.1 amidohydrolase family protein [Cryomorphaceae bacterium]MBT4222392.1 amidohydrolase family protein [Cryomorphaceae bacterium]
MKNLLIFLLMTTTLMSQDKYIHAGKIYDSSSGKYHLNKTIIISGNIISSIEDGFIEPKNEKILIYDLKSKVILPGLIDFHVHMESESGGKDRYINRFQENKADVAFKSTLVAKKTLLAGFTTVRDVGGSGVNISLRNAINNGVVIGPRIFTSGKTIATTGGHGDPTNGYKEGLIDDPGPKDGVVNSISDARKAVRYRYKNGADLIKITATGGVMSMAKNGQNPQFTEEVINAVVSTAKDYGMHVAAHAHGDEGMYRAVKSGVKTIEHGSIMKERTMKLMREKNAYLVPTISAGEHVAKMAKIPGYYPDIIIPKAIEVGVQNKATTKKAFQMGVPIAFGTDAGVYPHGDNAGEFLYMDEIGIPAEYSIKSATITNAKLLNMENLIGQIKKGFFADIIATDKSPTEDISTLKNVIFVMKNGEVYKK